jgi:hypothetical protein
VAVVNLPAYRWLWSYHDEMVRSKHRFRRSEVVDLMKRAGFTVEASTYWNTFLFPMIVVRRKLIRTPPKDGDVKLYPAAVEWIFNATMSVERALMIGIRRLPFGSSVMVLGRK